jgi:bifunctional non-homologous end joining protein LigD
MAKSHLFASYREKRDFSKTPEPEGTPAKRSGQRYLIQKHAATRLHYDFRLELDGVLKSWAVTRGPSLDPHERRLAVEVEDHPVAYGTFEGVIPKGQYGGGTVMLWDEGTWEPIGDPHQGLAKGKLEFALHGKRLQGEWTLVRMRDRGKDKGRRNWLLIKRTDDFARPGDNDRLLTEEASSVVSGRGMEDIAAAEDRVWQSQNAATTQDKLPEFIPPQLATLADAVPGGKNWVHEVKFDGYRALAYLQDKIVRIYTRTGQDWTHKFPTLAAKLAKLPAKTAILDGEIVAVDAALGATSFKALQQALSEKRDGELQYYVFDLLFLNGEDLREQPLLERKSRLEQLLKARAVKLLVSYSEHFTADGSAMLKSICGLHLEGVISKSADARYTSGRSAAWLKTKCRRRQEFVIGGFTLPTHAPRGVGALLVGYFDEDRLVYAGKVGTGFDHDSSLALRKRLDVLEDKAMPFAAAPATVKRGARWVKPTLVCEVEFSEWTADGRLRHPSFQGLRDDKPARSVARNETVATAPAKPATSEARGKTRGEIEVEGVRISHPERIIFPGTDITKLRLAEYYREVADRILPYVVDRPLSMLRCPDGAGGACFFQRHVARGQSPHIHETHVTVHGRNEDYLKIRDVQGLMSLVQWGVIELHPWGCLAADPERPDRMIFDLDPDPASPWEAVIEAAREIRMRMKEFGLESFLKTTGGKGLHVVVPIEPSYGWKPVKAFARAVAESMQHDDPKRYLARASKEARRGKIFVDYLRNDLTATAVAPYSVRARPGATVSLPQAWSQLKPSLRPDQFTVTTVPGLLKKQKTDPWADMLSVRQTIAERFLKALKIQVVQ